MNECQHAWKYKGFSPYRNVETFKCTLCNEEGEIAGLVILQHQKISMNYIGDSILKSLVQCHEAE